MSSTDTIKSLYDQVKQLDAGCAHFIMNKPFKDEKACAVIGVYDGQKPSHMVLDELWEWAEENGFNQVMDKIRELEDDISFLDK